MQNENSKSLFVPRPADLKVHIAWSVTAAYFELTQKDNPFFAVQRAELRKEVDDAAKAVKLKTSFFKSLANVQDDVTLKLLEALVATDIAKKDALIQQAIQALELPIPDECLR